MSITINFYDTISQIPSNIKTLSKLFEFVSIKYQLIPEDVEQLEFFYINENKEKKFILNNLDFSRACFQLKNSNVKEIIVQVKEESQLYKEINSSKIPIENISKNVKDDSQVLLLQQEIMEKEKELQLIIQKEKEQKEREEFERIYLEKKKAFEKLALEEAQKNKDLFEQKLNDEREMLKKRIEENKAKELESIKDSISNKATNENKQLQSKVKPSAIFDLSKEVANLQKIIEKAIKKEVSDKKPEIKKLVRKEEGASHKGVVCDGCKTAINGIRYKCSVCENFDYCDRCEEKLSESHQHPFLKIRNPNQAPISIKVETKLDQLKDKTNKVLKECETGIKKGFNEVVNFTTNTFNNIKYDFQAKDLQSKYNLIGVELTAIIKALEQAAGDEDKALSLLF